MGLRRDHKKNMKKIILASLIALIVGAIYSVYIYYPTTSPNSISFTLDNGIRIEGASNPRPLRYEDGTLYLMHNKNKAWENIEQNIVSVSKDDGLTFSRLNTDPNKYASGIQLPDGTYRLYYLDQTDKTVKSKSSKDNITYTDDPGVRYAPEGDEIGSDGFIGVYTYFIDNNGGVVFLYNATVPENASDKTTRVNIYRAYSKPDDGGWNFEFQNDDAIKFADFPEDKTGLRDPNAIRLPNGDIRLVAMYEYAMKSPGRQNGIIYTFISQDGGETFEFETEVVSWDDFEDYSVWSLNDPKLVLLDDGSCKIYVAAMIGKKSLKKATEDDLQYHIISLTSN